MPIFTVSVSCQRPGDLWTVRRAYTVVASYPSCEEALRGADLVAATLCQRMHHNVRIRVQRRDEERWQTYAIKHTHDNDSPAGMALRVLDKVRSGWWDTRAKAE